MMPAAPILSRLRSDPVAFVHEALGVRVVTDAQSTILKSVRDKRKTLVLSGNGVGKTFVAAACVAWFLPLRKDSRVLCTSSSGFQVRERLWAEVKRLVQRAKMPLSKYPPMETKWVIDNGWDAHAISTADPSNFQGGHSADVLIVFDEAQGVERGMWEAAESMMSSGRARWLAIANPLTASGAIYEASRRPDEWNVISMSCLDHPNVVEDRVVIPGAVTRAWVDERKALWGEDSPLYQSRVLGRFPSEGDRTLVSIIDLEACSALDRRVIGIEDGLWVGVDLARFGGDENVACVMEDRRVVAIVSWSGTDLMTTCGRIHELVKEYGAEWDHVNVDGCGLGGGVVDRLREQGHEVSDVQFGAGASDDWSTLTSGIKFVNRRAELYWTARSLLRAKQVAIPGRFARLWSDLITPQYEVRSDGAYKIEEKEQVRKRLGRSPDHGDAFVLALARERNAAPSLSFV